MLVLSIDSLIVIDILTCFFCAGNKALSSVTSHFARFKSSTGRGGGASAAASTSASSSSSASSASATAAAAAAPSSASSKSPQGTAAPKDGASAAAAAAAAAAASAEGASRRGSDSSEAEASPCGSSPSGSLLDDLERGHRRHGGAGGGELFSRRAGLLFLSRRPLPAPPANNGRKGPGHRAPPTQPPILRVRPSPFRFFLLFFQSQDLRPRFGRSIKFPLKKKLLNGVETR